MDFSFCNDIQENWDMLIDAIYLNLGPQDYMQVFKALRSIAENLFDEDDKYRILYADNKKVQQRILSRIGGYEFLRGLGFREITKRKLICEEPDFDVVATAITSINAKLALLEKNKPLPIIPDAANINHGMNGMDPEQKQNIHNQQQQEVDIDVDVNEYINHQNKPQRMKENPDIFPNNKVKSKDLPPAPSPHFQGLHDSMNKQFREKYSNPSSPTKPELKELKLDKDVSNAIKSDPRISANPNVEKLKAVDSGGTEINYEDANDDEKKAVLHDTIDMDINEENDDEEAEGKPVVKAVQSPQQRSKSANNVNSSSRDGIGSPQGRQRASSKVTSAYYSDDEDEKQGLIFKPQPAEMETDAGFQETEEYFANLKRFDNKIGGRGGNRQDMGRKRSCSDDANGGHNRQSSIQHYQKFFNNNQFDNNAFEKPKEFRQMSPNAPHAVRKKKNSKKVHFPFML